MINKIAMQIVEADEQGMTKLAEDVREAFFGAEDDHSVSVDYEQLTSQIKSIFWRAAREVIDLHQPQSVDIKRVDDAIDDIVEGFIRSVECSIHKEADLSKTSKVIGQE
jgi:phosphate uptake regulator